MRSRWRDIEGGDRDACSVEGVSGRGWAMDRSVSNIYRAQLRASKGMRALLNSNGADLELFWTLKLESLDSWG